jgi:hypothetical protein
LFGEKVITVYVFPASPACTELEMVTMDWLAQMLRQRGHGSTQTKQQPFREEK